MTLPLSQQERTTTLIGHAHLTSTMIYLHTTTVGEEHAVVKINQVMRRKS